LEHVAKRAYAGFRGNANVGVEGWVCVELVTNGFIRERVAPDQWEPDRQLLFTALDPATGTCVTCYQLQQQLQRVPFETKRNSSAKLGTLA